MLPFRPLAGLVGAALRTDRTPLRVPPSVTARAARSLLRLRRRLASVRERRVEVDGFCIPYLEGGPPNAEPVVMVHGFSDTKDSFVDVAGILAKRYRVLLPDLPGFSEASQPWDFTYSLPNITAVLAEAVRALGIARAHWVGNSLGGAIAARVAIDAPTHVRSLALLGAAGVPMPQPSPLQQQIDAGDNPFVVSSYEGWSAFIEMALQRPPRMPGVVKRHLARTFIGRAAMNDKIMGELLAGDFDLTARLGEIVAPTLALWGTHDRFIDPSAGQVYERGIPNARLELLEGIGHCPQVEAPARTAKLLQTHIADL